MRSSELEAVTVNGICMWIPGEDDWNLTSRVEHIDGIMLRDAGLLSAYREVFLTRSPKIRLARAC